MSAFDDYELEPAFPTPPPAEPTAVLRRNDAAAWAELADETVVFRGQLERTYILSSVAGLVWKCLDGESTLEEILADVADAFEVDPAQVFDDFLPIVGEWIRGGAVTAVPEPGSDDDGDVRTDEVAAWHRLQPSPNVCGKAELPRWPHHIVVGIGGTAITVGSDRPEVIDALEPWRIDLQTKQINYVLELDPPRLRGPRSRRPLPNFSHGCEPMFRLRDQAALLDVFWRTMASFTVPDDPGQLRVRLMPVIRDGRALLLPPEHGGAISVHAYSARSIQPLYTLASIIDVDAWTVRVDPPLIDDAATPPEATRWYPITDWWLPTTDPSAHVTPGEAVAFVLRWCWPVSPKYAAALLRLAVHAVEHQLPGLAPIAPDGLLEQISAQYSNQLRDELLHAIVRCFEGTDAARSG